MSDILLVLVVAAVVSALFWCALKSIDAVAQDKLKRLKAQELAQWHQLFASIEAEAIAKHKSGQISHFIGIGDDGEMLFEDNKRIG